MIVSFLITVTILHLVAAPVYLREDKTTECWLSIFFSMWGLLAILAYFDIL